MTKTLTLVAAAFGLSVAATAPGVTQDRYVSVSAGINFQADSDNSGAFTRDFVTGEGVAVPAGTILADGTSLGWTTEFEEGLFLSGAVGLRLSEAFRAELEVSYTSSDVGTHGGVLVGGGSIDAADAGVLITGSGALGATVGAIVADGQGDISTLGYAINGFYDIDVPDTPFTAYVGGGLGIAEVDVEFIPSGISVVSDTEMVGFFQVMVGGTIALSDTTELFTGYRFRQSQDADVDSTLLPASLDIENTNHILEAGVRLRF